MWMPKILPLLYGLYVETNGFPNSEPQIIIGCTGTPSHICHYMIVMYETESPSLKSTCNNSMTCLRWVKNEILENPHITNI